VGGEAAVEAGGSEPAGGERGAGLIAMEDFEGWRIADVEGMEENDRGWEGEVRWEGGGKGIGRGWGLDVGKVFGI